MTAENKKIISSDTIRGHIDTMILRLLREGDKYGYQMFKLIIERSRGQFELKEPSMYSSLRRMEQQGMIASYWGDEESQGGRRRYYKILPPGETMYQSNRDEWEFAKSILDLLI